MNEENSSEFRIRFDEEAADSVYQQEIKDLRIEKLSQRVTLISILIPLLIGIMLFLAYFDIKERVVQTHDVGAEKVLNLSKDLEASFSSLSVKFAKLEESFASKFTALEQATAGLKAAMAKTGQAIQDMQSSKSDKTELNHAVAQLKKTLTPIHKDLKNFKTTVSEIKTLEKEFKQQLAKLSATVNNTDKNIKKFNQNVSALAASQIDQEALDSALRTEQKRYQQKLNEATLQFGDRIKSLQNQIKDLDWTIKSTRLSRSKPGKGAESKGESVAPKSGAIIEQDIE